MIQLYLASNSPRRQMLLQQLGLTFNIIKPDIDESIIIGETPTDYALRLAKDKAQKGLQQLASQKQNACILSADTIVTIEDKILGKPQNQTDAIDMLLQLSEKTHRVITAITVQTVKQQLTKVSYTDVTMRKISKQEALAYWHTGEPADKAGAYAIQGVAAIFIEKIQGDYYTVMGLPLFITSQLLNQIGIKIL